MPDNPLSTDEYREAVNHIECVGCLGAFSGPDHTQPMRDWHDKPHRLVLDLCDEVDRLTALAADPLNPRYLSEFRDWQDFVNRVARPLVEAEDDIESERAAMALYRKASPYSICVFMVMMADRITPEHWGGAITDAMTINHEVVQRINEQLDSGIRLPRPSTEVDDGA